MSELDQATETVVSYLAAMERRDLDRARACVTESGLDLVFPGDRHFGSVDEIVRNSSGRYRFVKKRISGGDAWRAGDAVRVLITGTLYGEWPDGTPFEGIRFVDWFEVQGGLIVRQHVFNDAGERLLEMQKMRTE